MIYASKIFEIWNCIKQTVFSDNTFISVGIAIGGCLCNYQDCTYIIRGGCKGRYDIGYRKLFGKKKQLKTSIGYYPLSWGGHTLDNYRYQKHACNV